MVLFHPGVARIDCRDCCKRLYNLETGEPETTDVGTEDEPRIEYYDGPDHKPPCQNGVSCPRVSPEIGPTFNLSPRNKAILRIYFAQRATSGASLTPAQRADPFLLECLAIVDGLVREFERVRESEQQSLDSARLLLMIRGAL